MLKGVLEADFVEPAHDKQGFERTTVLSRLETRLLVMQKNYWFVAFFSCFLENCRCFTELFALLIYSGG